MLEMRRNAIDGILRKAETRAIAQKVGQIFVRFPATRVPDNQLAATIAAYTADLSTFPMWVIDAAYKRIIEGHAGLSASFAPSSTEVRCVCEQIIDPISRERADIDAVLGAEVVSEQSPEQRAKVLAGLRDLREKLAESVDPLAKKPPTQAEAMSQIERWAEASTPQNPIMRAPEFSPTLRKALGLPPTPPVDDDFEF